MRLHSIGFILTMHFFILATSCRLARAGKETADGSEGVSAESSPKTPMVQPPRPVDAGGGNQTLPVKLDDHGRLIGQAVLRLDYFAPPRPGGVTLPSCYEAITEKLVLGKLQCQADTVLKVDVTADHFDQICYTSSQAPRVPAKLSVELPRCKGAATLVIYAFTPEMKVEIKP